MVRTCGSITRSRLFDLNLSPNPINTRLATIKSLVDRARKLNQCGFSLEDIAILKVEVYRDTSGVDPDIYRVMIEAIDRDTIGGKRDYAIMRLLWIIRKGKLQKQAIDLAVKTRSVLAQWLSVRGESRVNLCLLR